MSRFRRLQDQPIPLFDPATKLVDAGNWSVSATWDVPADAVSGVYFAKLTRLDGVQGENIIPFIVRDDEHPSDITLPDLRHDVAGIQPVGWVQSLRQHRWPC